MPVRIHMGHIESVMRHADKVLRQQFEGKNVLLGVDDMDIFKGINLKLNFSYGAHAQGASKLARKSCADPDC
ncbi:hypothetical protein ACS0TY_022544 [Phlomoides rotata]